MDQLMETYVHAHESLLALTGPNFDSVIPGASPTIDHALRTFLAAKDILHTRLTENFHTMILEAPFTPVSVSKAAQKNISDSEVEQLLEMEETWDFVFDGEPQLGFKTSVIASLDGDTTESESASDSDSDVGGDAILHEDTIANSPKQESIEASRLQMAMGIWLGNWDSYWDGRIVNLEIKNIFELNNCSRTGADVKVENEGLRRRKVTNI